MKTKQKGGQAFMQQVNKKKHIDCALSSNSDTSEDEVDEIQVLKKDTNKQRFSVSAEAYGEFNKKENFKAKEIQKSQEQILRIRQRISEGFMFSALDEKGKRIVIGAMEEKKFKKDDWIIKQGEEGDVLYVVDSGELDCFKDYGDGVNKYIKTYQAGESFGELALLFQSPRAASIRVKSKECVLWQLDRETFSIIVKEASIKKREQYENFLRTWDLLAELDEDPYEKLKISDALMDKDFKKGETIYSAGQRFNEIFIINQGKVGVFKGQQQILELSKCGDYFGEISVSRSVDEPFTYVALDECRLMYIPKRSYSSTLKIIDATIQKRIQQKYGKHL